jgi:hypothetical protein
VQQRAAYSMMSMAEAKRPLISLNEQKTMKQGFA